MPAGVLGGMGPEEVEHLGIVIQVAVVAVHQLGLAEVDGFAADVDERGAEEIEPEPGFRPAHVGDGLARPPVVFEAPSGIEHVGIAEIAFLDGLAQGGKGPVRDGDLVRPAW